MAEQIIDNPVTEELSRSFLEYSLSVIVSRALPDVRDGLKPVHRRILYSMYDQGIRPSVPHSKCAKVVGDTMGRFHPHGDSAIYEALVRLAQWWSLRVPLVDGHGNFGSSDDGPAAARYTECRLDAAGLALLEDIREDTVDMVLNYDGTVAEPDVLPSAFPNLLVNGSQGIAVGMATNLVPHNLGEVVAGLKALLADPTITLDEMMVHIPGPDLPTGGIIYQMDGVREAYASGRGVFKMRARAKLVDITARKKGIEVNELPYQIGPEKVIARIKELTAAKKLAGIADVKDLSDRKVGLKLVIECKSGFNPAAVLEELYRLTPMEESFGINNVALVDGQPRTMGLVELGTHFLAHRRIVVTRRTTFRLAKAEARAHLIEGLLVALDAIDAVVKAIRASKDTDTARTRLRKEFTLSEIQASHILEMPLRRLTSLEVTKLRDEMRELKETMTTLRTILGTPAALTAVVAHELDVTAESFATPRRSTLLEELASSPQTATLEEPDQPCILALSVRGTLGRFSPEVSRAKPTALDAQRALVSTTTRGTVYALTSTGRLHTLSVLEVPQIARKDRGAPVGEYLALAAGEQVVSLVAATTSTPIAMATRRGTVKRLDPAQIPTRTPAAVITLADGDALVGAAPSPDNAYLVLVTTEGQLLRTPASKVRPQGRSAGGVSGIRLPDAHSVVAFAVPLEPDVRLVTATDKGSIKATALDEYPEKGRGGAGVRCMRLLASEQSVAAAWIGPVEELLALDSAGVPVAEPVPEGRRDATGTKLAEPVTGLAQRTPRAPAPPRR